MEQNIEIIKYKFTISSLYNTSRTCFPVPEIVNGSQLGLFFIGDMDGANSLNSVVLVIRVISLCLLVVPFLSVTRGYLQGNKYVAPSSFSQLLEQI